MTLSRLCFARVAKVQISAPIREVRIYEDRIAIVFHGEKEEANEVVVVFDFRPNIVAVAKATQVEAISRALTLEERDEAIIHAVFNQVQGSIASVSIHVDDDTDYFTYSSYVELHTQEELTTPTLFTVFHHTRYQGDIDENRCFDWLWCDDGDQGHIIGVMTDERHCLSIKQGRETKTIGAPS